MILVYLFSVIDLVLLCLGLAYSIIDIQKYNFALYLVLLAIVCGTILIALCVVKPKFCATPSWFFECLQRLSRSQAACRSAGGQFSPREKMHLLDGAEKGQLDPLRVLHNMTAIPFLIQAIQYSMETPPSVTTTGGLASVVSGAFATNTRTEATTSGFEDTTSRTSYEESWVEMEGGATHLVFHPKLRLAIKRQSMAIFPLSETGSAVSPPQPHFSKVRRVSSCHELNSSFDDNSMLEMS